MYRFKSIEEQNRRSSDAKRLRELQYENDFLKLLYTDLLAKTVVLKGGLARGLKEC